MEDHIVFLGTGGDSIVVGQQLRASGGIVLQMFGNQFHLDPGPGALVMLNHERINPREHIALFVTNRDIVNSGDSNAVLSAMTHDGLDKRGILVGSDDIIKPQENESPINAFYRACTEKSIGVRPGSKIGINEVDIEATPTSYENTVGFKFTTPKYSLSYTSDTSFFPELTEAHKEVDVLIVNCKNFEENEEGHLNAEDVCKLLEIAKPKLAIITHYGIKVLQEGPVNVAREIQKKTGVQTMAAKDGVSINPINFSSKNRQQRLRSSK